METKEKFKKLGYFWLPSAPDKKVPGTLSISDVGHIAIEIIGEFNDKAIKSLFNSLSRDPKSTEEIEYAERMVGYVETDGEYIKNDGRVTLDNCHFIGPYTQIEGPHSLLKFAIFADRIFIHAKYNENEIPCFKNFIFSIEGIEEWSGISNFRMLEYDENNITMTYQAPKNISLNLNNDMQLFIKFPHTDTLESEISPKTYFELFSKNACELDEVTSVAEKIRTFLCFAINEMIPFDSTSAALNDRPIHMRKPPLIDIYDSRCFYLQDEPKINRGMLFKFEKIQTDAGLIINKWLEVCDDISPALDLYLTAQKQQYLTQKFLNLAQCLEAYHKGVDAYYKRTSGKESSKRMTLKKRLMCLSEPLKHRFENENMRDKWMADIKNARDDLTHEGELKSKEAYNELSNFIGFCLAAFQINLLQVIGFSQEDIDSIINNSTQIRRRF